MSNPNFAIYYVSDGYSTDQKIMGRQSAGKALIKGVARKWKTSELHGFGASRSAGQTMLKQLQGDGYSGTLRWRESPGDRVLDELGAVYFPAPITKTIAHARNTRSPGAYSLFGVTHTLSSAGAMDQISDLILPPFKPWDALVCTSTAALGVVERLQAEMKAWFAEHTGATRFNPIVQPVIPLGVNAPDFVRTDDQRVQARYALGLEANDVAFLFAGRLSFHAKANPAVFYQALEAACQQTGKTLVCIEAGVYPSSGMAQAFEAARGFLAPSARFIQVDGQNEALYHQAWKASDVFVSLSDNIQETFGLTPLEAMAAGMPVLVSDWDGYKDTVRDGIDGYRIQVTAPKAGAGDDLALRHALGQDTYDYYIGRVSMATAIDLGALTDRIIALAQDDGLRRKLGSAGQARIEASYDWPVILERYVDLARSLGEIRKAAAVSTPQAWGARPDPYRLFQDYPTRALAGDWSVVVHPDRAKGVESFLDLGIASYVLDPVLLPRETITALLHEAGRKTHTVASLLAGHTGSEPAKTRALMWLYKLGLLDLRP